MQEHAGNFERNRDIFGSAHQTPPVYVGEQPTGVKVSDRNVRRAKALPA